jgi:ribosomal protein S18 acetylase RimI-like enzyme
MRKFDIIDALPEDHNAVFDLVLLAFQEYSVPMRSNWNDYREVIIHSLGDHKRARRIIAKSNDSILGSVLLYPPGEELFVPDSNPVVVGWPLVRLLAVSPEARNRGIGTALMNKCIQQAEHAGNRFLALHTTDMMVVAMRMYKKLGFKRYSKIDFHPAKDVLVKGYIKILYPK